MDRRETLAIGRRAALMSFAGVALVGSSGCAPLMALIAKLQGDDSFGEDGGDKKAGRSDRRGKRSEQEKASPSDPAATGGAPSSGDTSSEETFGE